MTTFHVKYDAGSPVLRLHLHPLSDYVADGGRFTDTGNGGEDCRAKALADEFVAAISVDETTLDGLTVGDACDLAGAKQRWYDSATGWMLLREWPAEAPLEARVGGCERLTPDERALLVDEVTIRQTIGGAYSSFPEPSHIAALLAGDREWENLYAARGHGEYIDNVHDVAEAVRSLHPTVDQRDAVIAAVLSASREVLA